MAVTGKKINELTQLNTVTNETVLPVVYVDGQTTAETAQKITVSQVSSKVQSDLSSTLATKQDVLTAGNGIDISNNSTISAQQAIEALVASSGTIALDTNKVYKISLDGNTTFSLPVTLDNTIFNQILLQLQITGTITIDWGTTHYFIDALDLEAGVYDIVYEYNSLENVWYVGRLGGESGGGGGGGAPTLYWYTGNIGSTVTVVSTSGATLVKVYKNGLLLQPTEDYSLSGTTLTMVSALVSTDKITLEVF